MAYNSGIGALKDNFGRPTFDPSKGGVKGGVQGGGFYMGLLQDHNIQQIQRWHCYS